MTEQEQLADPFADREMPGVVVTRTALAISSGEGPPVRSTGGAAGALQVAIAGAVTVAQATFVVDAINAALTTGRGDLTR
jgi:hypothetical protein